MGFVSVSPVPPTALRGTGLTLSYRRSPVVTDADLALGAGRVTTLVGPNGSGKSTLLRALARLHPADRGSVSIDDDVDVSTMRRQDFARRVTLLAQSRPSPSGISVRDMVGYGRHPYVSRWRSLGSDDRIAIDTAMERTGVTTMADRPIDELSGGELQRVWLAACLAQQTDVLLLDEPTTFLDLRYQIELLDLIRDLADDHGVAVGLVLHDLNQAAEVSDVIAVLDGGCVQATGAPSQVLTPTLLSRVYGIEIDVDVDPASNLVRTRPRSRHHARVRAV